MKEYWLDQNGRDFNALRAERMPEESYVEAHKSLVIACEDAFIEYRGGILLVNRDREPAKDLLWSPGGRIQRGMSLEESLKYTIKKECNLDLEELEELGSARFYSNSDPYGHDKGTDGVTFVFFARGYGRLKLDGFHSQPAIIKPEDYTSEFRKTLHPFIQHYMDIAIKML